MAVVEGKTTLTGVLQTAGQRRSPVQRLDRLSRQRAEAHARDVDHGCRPEGQSAAPGLSQNLCTGQPRLLVGMPVGGVLTAEGAVMDDHVAVGVLQIVVRAEAEVVVLELRRCVDPATLVPAERPLLVVRGHDVLPQLRTDRLEPEPRMPDDREVAQQRMPTLQQVVSCDGGHGRDRGGLPQALHPFTLLL